MRGGSPDPPSNFFFVNQPETALLDRWYTEDLSRNTLDFLMRFCIDQHLNERLAALIEE